MFENAAKALSWLSNMFPEVYPAESDADILSICIHRYCANGAEAITKLNAFNIMWQAVAIAAKEGIPKWISVKDKLPEYDFTDVEILLHDKRHGLEDSYLVGTGYVVRRHWEHYVEDEEGNFEVIAWRPGTWPEPPKEE